MPSPSAYQHGTEARNILDELALQPQRRYELPEDVPIPHHHVRIKAKTAVSPLAVIGVLVVCIMMVLVIFSYSQLYETTVKVSKLESRLSSLLEEQAKLESKYQGRLDLGVIEAKAESLGLHAPREDQIIYISMPTYDRAEMFTQEKESYLKKIVEAIHSAASGLLDIVRNQYS